jgi:hypothetical protein
VDVAAVETAAVEAAAVAAAAAAAAASMLVWANWEGFAELHAVKHVGMVWHVAMVWHRCRRRNAVGFSVMGSLMGRMGEWLSSMAAD